MKTKPLKTLSFEPVYHRRVSQGKYAITLKATKGAKMSSFKAAIAERDKILLEGFVIIEIDIERPHNDTENVDKGDVVAVIANTNPLFKMNLD